MCLLQARSLRIDLKTISLSAIGASVNRLLANLPAPILVRRSGPGRGEATRMDKPSIPTDLQRQ
jgi:hypothetical protein